MHTRRFTSWPHRFLILAVTLSVMLIEGEQLSSFGKNLLESHVRIGRKSFEFEKNSEPVRKTFDQVVEKVVPVTVKIEFNEKQVALGMIINSNGWIVTKSSECPSKNLTCVLSDGRSFDVQSISRDNNLDLAILKINVKNLPVVLRYNEKPLLLGQWAITPGLTAVPLAVGVISENSRKIRQHTGLIGTQLKNDVLGVLVEKVYPNTGAAKAGLKKGDILKTMEGVELSNAQSVTRLLRRFAPGTTLKTTFLRDGEIQTIKITIGEPMSSLFSRSGFQNRMGGKLSRRREGFSSVFQHDCPLSPQQCGGPIVDLDGNVIGLNIARAGRVESYAIPARLLREKINLMITMHEENKEVD